MEEDVFAGEEDGGCRIEGVDDLKKRNTDDVYQDKEGLSSSLSSSEGSYCSLSGAEEEEILKKKSKFDLDKVVEEDEDVDKDVDEDEDEDEEADVDVDDEDDLEEEEAEEGSKFTWEEVKKMEVKPEEYKVELSEEERKFYKSRAYLARPMVVMKKVDEGSMDYYHFITDEELRIYNEQNQKSEGFDIPLLPGAVYPGMKVPNNLTIKSVGSFVAKISKFALMYYNNKNGTNYVLKCLKKSNAAPTNMLTYYITFEAMSAVDPDHTVTFEAKLHREFTSDIQVMICRIKE